ncbi:Membrane magnesium transporter 1 [Eumeta japonica]|uniref:Membrane magnesium transporter n=1 Tax=Eumeta variegata TaxID=151549 RepID=A0A4C1W8X2_EUMVA|nr:Membrane magnesium transporter 1 [Eumeta japonica]
MGRELAVALLRQHLYGRLDLLRPGASKQGEHESEQHDYEKSELNVQLGHDSPMSKSRPNPKINHEPSPHSESVHLTAKQVSVDRPRGQAAICCWSKHHKTNRSYLRITSQEFTSLPLDIIIQAVVSLFMVMWGVLHVAGNLREIPAAAELNMVKWETQRNLPSFYVFNHRGRALSPSYVPSIGGKGDLENVE